MFMFTPQQYVPPLPTVPTSQTTHLIRLFLPEAYDHYYPSDGTQENLPVDTSYVCKTMARLFGGVTEILGRGWWYSDKDELVAEDVYILESYTLRSIQTIRYWMHNIAAEIASLYNQQEILYIIDGDRYTYKSVVN